MSERWERFSTFERTIITIALMAATLMQVLDITIVNVSLPHMQGSLNANPDEISWVLTSYLVSAAIFMPLTGYFTDRIGQKKFLIFSIFGFIVASALCGAATSLYEMVGFRLLQGVFGAALIPLSQAILIDIYPPQQRSVAMAIWGMGVTVGPILGPTLGGYLTDIASWRWNFYINIPTGFIALFLLTQFLPETEKKARKMDWMGFLLISLGIGGIQYFLDRGNHQDWFAALDIRIAALSAVVGIGGFIIYSFYPRQKSIVNINIFKDRNFTVSCALLGTFGIGLFGMMLIMPLMMESLLNFPALTAGLAMAPRGISSMVSMWIAALLLIYVDERVVIALGIGLAGFGSAIGMNYNLQIDIWWVVFPMVLQGLGVGFIFATLTVVAFKTLPPYLRSEAAGIYSLVRTMGSSIGISMVTTMFMRYAQQSWNDLGSFINPYNPALHEYLNAANLTLQDPAAGPLLGKQLLMQSQMVALNGVFAFITGSFVLMFLLLFFYKKDSTSSLNNAATSSPMHD